MSNHHYILNAKGLAPDMETLLVPSLLIIDGIDPLIHFVRDDTYTFIAASVYSDHTVVRSVQAYMHAIGMHPCDYRLARVLK